MVWQGVSGSEECTKCRGGGWCDERHDVLHDRRWVVRCIELDG